MQSSRSSYRDSDAYQPLLANSTTDLVGTQRNSNAGEGLNRLASSSATEESTDPITWQPTYSNHPSTRYLSYAINHIAFLTLFTLGIAATALRRTLLIDGEGSQKYIQLYEDILQQNCNAACQDNPELYRASQDTARINAFLISLKNAIVFSTPLDTSSLSFYALLAASLFLAPAIIKLLNYFYLEKKLFKKLDLHYAYQSPVEQARYLVARQQQGRDNGEALEIVQMPSGHLALLSAEDRKNFIIWFNNIVQNTYDYTRFIYPRVELWSTLSLAVAVGVVLYQAGARVNMFTDDYNQVCASPGFDNCASYSAEAASTLDAIGIFRYNVATTLNNMSSSLAYNALLLSPEMAIILDLLLTVSYQNCVRLKRVVEPVTSAPRFSIPRNDEEHGSSFMSNTDTEVPNTLHMLRASAGASQSQRALFASPVSRNGSGSGSMAARNQVPEGSTDSGILEGLLYQPSEGEHQPSAACPPIPSYIRLARTLNLLGSSPAGSDNKQERSHSVSSAGSRGHPGVFW